MPAQGLLFSGRHPQASACCMITERIGRDRLAAAGVAWRAWRQFGENPLQALFGAAIVALLVFSFTTTNDRIDDTNKRIDDTNDRITRLESRMDARFTVLEEGVAEINLKLTALIASLNRTDEVSAALEGRIIDRAQAPHPADGAPG